MKNLIAHFEKLNQNLSESIEASRKFREQSAKLAYNDEDFDTWRDNENSDENYDE